MKIGCIILCRYNSSRLPGKILKKINGKPLLSYIYESLIQVFESEDIVVATSEESTDNPIIEYCISQNIRYFRGSLNNVALRFLQCADYYTFDYAVRINGDNIFVNLESLKNLLYRLSNNNYLFLSNVKGRTYPKGMSTEIIYVSFYKLIYEEFFLPQHYEHVTLFLYQLNERDDFFFQYNLECPEAAGIQLALDTQEDFILIEKMINALDDKIYNHSLREIYNIYKKYNETI